MILSWSVLVAINHSLSERPADSQSSEPEKKEEQGLNGATRGFVTSLLLPEGEKKSRKFCTNTWLLNTKNWAPSWTQWSMEKVV